jgi:hypothetical protein
MIEHLFGLVNPWRDARDRPCDRSGARRRRGKLPRNSRRIDETDWLDPASTTHMKRDSVSLVAATLRTGIMLGFALILIYVLFPAAMAQAAGPR